MKRVEYHVTVTDVGRQEIVATSSKFAKNSGIRESEALVRQIARDEGTIYYGDKPVTSPFYDRSYHRTWRGGNARVLLAIVTKAGA